MIYVGIDVAKNKHDCCILGPDGEIIRNVFTFLNTRQGFQLLEKEIRTAASSQNDQEIKTGLEATGHYGVNLVSFLRSKGMEPVVFNPLRVKLYRQSLSLRRTKTDKVDARCIASLVMSEDSNPVTPSYQILELKSLARHRFHQVQKLGKEKAQLGRLVDLLFPELPSVCFSVTQKTILDLLHELPGAQRIAHCRINRLRNLIIHASNGRYDQNKASQISQLAKQSVGTDSESLEFELVQTIESIYFLQRQLKTLNLRINSMLRDIDSPLLTIPGIGNGLASLILGEIGDISRFSSPDKLLAYAGIEPSSYQSGNFTATRTPMVKRGSTYLRWALIQAARHVAQYCPEFHAFLEKKISQGKHYFVALGHLAKKLVRVIFHLLSNNKSYLVPAER